MGRYRNLDGTTPDKRLGDMWKWMVADRVLGRRPKRVPFATPRRENDGALLAESSPHLTWIGHASFAMRLGEKLVVTDPVWSERLSSVIKRNVAPGVALEEMPKVDIVTVSHSHYDHMDMPTLKRIKRAWPECVFVVPKDNAEVLLDGGIDRVVELGWFETHVEDGVKVTLVPAQHWSLRVPWDRNERLWGGFVYESAEGTAYHAGDTAFGEDVFRKIHDRFPAIDWAMIPVGAYDPTWFMQEQHIGPEDAGRAWEILGAKTFVAMHWGTFRLTDEPMSEPPDRIRTWFETKGYPGDRLWVLDIGETRALSAT